MGRNRADAETEATPEAGPKMSKTDAVKAALAEGVEKPKDGAAFIGERYGLDVTAQQFSQTKSLLKKREQGAETAPEPARTLSASNNGHHAPAGGVADSVEAIKQLIDRMGADEVVKIAELFRR